MAASVAAPEDDFRLVQTVFGPIAASKLGFMLTHAHVMPVTMISVANALSRAMRSRRKSKTLRIQMGW
jgi:predicted metal-dependent phosphotriesterase family hydrolase